MSYLLSGGLSMVAPWVRPGNLGYPLVRIENAPSMQLDFSGTADAAFLDSDCDLFGRTGFAIGIRLCVAEARPNSGQLRAGTYAVVIVRPKTRSG
jgi:hypothetical protein